MNFVLDASVALLWLVPGTNPAGVPYASTTLRTLKQASACVPSLWALEIANVIAKLEARTVVSVADVQRYLALLARLAIATDTATATHALGQTLDLAQRYKLSAYDASYLELALRNGLPLATLDTDLHNAALAAGVPLLP